LKYFKKGDQFAHQKINENNTFLALTNSKVEIPSKFKKTDDDLNYLAKFVEQLFSKPHPEFPKHQKVQKTNSKSPFKHFRFGRSKSPVKGAVFGFQPHIFHFFTHSSFVEFVQNCIHQL
jgi:hypothetical protein